MPAEGQLCAAVHQELPRTGLEIILVETWQALEAVTNLVDMLEQKVIFILNGTDIDTEATAV